MKSLGWCWVVGGLLLSACGGTDETAVRTGWPIVARSPEAALLSVHGTSDSDVWLAGADAGDGPVVLHWDGGQWQRLDTGVTGDLWWVQALEGGSVYFSGSDAHVLRYRDGVFERLATPGLGKHIVFGVWAASDDDVYAVGSAQGRNGFIWHYDGTTWSDLALPGEVPLDEAHDAPSFFKVWGRADAGSGSDVWVVGDRGVVLRGNAAGGFRRVETPDDDRLLTVHGNAEGVVVVGGSTGAVVLEGSDRLTADAPEGAGLLQGVWADDEATWAVGLGGSVYRRESGEPDWTLAPANVAVQSLHAVWVDPAGGVWAVGGNTLSTSLDAGLATHDRDGVSEISVRGPQASPNPTCQEAAIDPAPEASVARRWNEQLLGAIRRDTPQPTVHARNLFHVSVAMWDAWAAYDAVADGYLSSERLAPSDVAAARDQAISHAAYGVLSHRYARAVGGALSLACFDAFLGRLGYDATDTHVDGDDPVAVGNRIARLVIDTYQNDGANESANYADPEGYVPDRPRLVVDLPGTRATDPLAWQQLELTEAVTQNGISEGSGVRGYVGPHWGAVTPFAVERPGPGLPYIDIGSPPVALDQALLDAVVGIIRKSAELDVEDGVLWDISPGGYGNNPLASDAGQGHPQNPVTGQPYAPEMVLRGDFTRVLAEFWADGPASETPPGHWNTLANSVAYDPRFERRPFGEGEPLDALEWDVRTYLALNGAVHDAAIVAWELKRTYESARPITLVRYLGGLGQRTDPGQPSYHPDGLPLVDGLIEVVTAASSAPGQRHAHLARYLGEIAVRTWRGEPGDRDRQIGGVGWERAVDWMPYQRRFFVTPAFPGYVSGHSTFSRSAAVVLHQLTGSPYFPGGLGTYVCDPGYLFFEYGPTNHIELQWATYYDASDQAGQSRIWGGIHIAHDDYDGRRAGQRVGELALERARPFFDGSARP